MKKNLATWNIVFSATTQAKIWSDPIQELSAAFLNGGPQDYYRVTCLGHLSTTENPGQAYNKVSLVQLK